MGAALDDMPGHRARGELVPIVLTPITSGVVDIAERVAPGFALLLLIADILLGLACSAALVVFWLRQSQWDDNEYGPSPRLAEA